MKIIKFLSALLLLNPIQIDAQTIIGAYEHELCVIPGIFTCDSKPKIHTCNWISSEVDIENGFIKVYDHELSEIASINYKPDKYLSYQHQHADLSYGWNAPLVVQSENFQNINWVEIDFLDMRKDISHYSDAPILLTQNLFNDDEKYEYIVPKYRLEEERVEERSGVTGPIEDVYIYGHCYITGIEVRSENENVIFSIDFNREYEDIRCKVVLWEDKTYLALSNSDDYGYTSTFYLLKREASNISVKKVENIGSLKLLPSFARKNTMVTIDLGEYTKESDGMLFVTDINGKTIYYNSIASRMNSIQTPINHFSSGLYIVYFTSAGNPYETAKLIVN